MKLLLIISGLMFFSVASFAANMNDPGMKDFIGNRTQVQAGTGTVGGECPDGTCFDTLDASPMVGTKGILNGVLGNSSGATKGVAPAAGTDGI